MRRIVIAATAAVLLWAQAARAADFSDLWWKPGESGWGASIVQQGETAFVMVFAYAADGSARWYVASDARVIAYAPGGLPVFSGTLHRGRGPWHGAPFDPSRVEMAVVGTVGIETLAADRLRLHFEAEGATTVKELERLTWSRPEVDGFYLATFNLRQTFPNGAAYGTMAFGADALLRLEGPALSIRTEDTLGRTCEYSGGRTQAGHSARATGTFQCTPGTGGIQGSAGTFEIEDLHVTEHGFTGHLRTVSPDNLQRGPFSGTRR